MSLGPQRERHLPFRASARRSDALLWLVDMAPFAVRPGNLRLQSVASVAEAPHTHDRAPIGPHHPLLHHAGRAVEGRESPGNEHARAVEMPAVMMEEDRPMDEAMVEERPGDEDRPVDEAGMEERPGDEERSMEEAMGEERPMNEAAMD